MAKLNLTHEPEHVNTTLDTVTIIKCLEQIVGGRVLDTTGFKPKVIQAGHVIIRDKQGAKEYKPMPLDEGGKTYASLPSNHEIVGVAYCSILASKPLASIMVRGAVNRVSSPYPVTTEIERDLPLIRFTQED